MKTTKHPFRYNYKAEFPNLKEIAAFEGGVIYAALKNNNHFLIIDEGTMAEFLDEDDKDLLDQLIKIIEFDSEEELNNYLIEKNAYIKRSRE